MHEWLQFLVDILDKPLRQSRSKPGELNLILIGEINDSYYFD